MSLASLRRRGAGVLLATVVGAVALAGCDEEEPDGPSSSERDEAGTLLSVLIDDPAGEALDDVQNVVERRLNLRAADLLRDTAIEAADAQAARVGRVELTEESVQALQRRAAAALEARARSLREYETVLRRGDPDGLALVEAMGRVREAELALLEVLEALEGVRAGRLPPSPAEGGPD